MANNVTQEVLFQVFRLTELIHIRKCLLIKTMIMFVSDVVNMVIFNVIFAHSRQAENYPLNRTTPIGRGRKQVLYLVIALSMWLTR